MIVQIDSIIVMLIKKVEIIISFTIVMLFSLIGNAQDNINAEKYYSKLKPYKYSFVDTAGKMHTLKEFKGKYIYLDVWASWCYPCTKEYPELVKMKRQLDINRIQVVNLSIDNGDFRWKGALSFWGMSGNLWRVTDTTFEHDFYVYRIPRFILINKKGKIIKFEMTRPSNPETLLFLNKF